MGGRGEVVAGDDDDLLDVAVLAEVFVLFEDLGIGGGRDTDSEAILGARPMM